VAKTFLLEDSVHLNNYWPLWNLSNYIISVPCPCKTLGVIPQRSSASLSPTEIFVTLMPVVTSHPSDTGNPAGGLRSVSNYF